VILARGSNIGGGYLEVFWSQVIGANGYTVYYRRSINSGWEIYRTYSSPVVGFLEPMPANTTWLFAVQANTSSGPSPMSAPAMATSVSFTDDPIAPGTTIIKALHLTELLSAVNIVRTFAALSPLTFTNTIAAGHPVSALEIMQLRGAISEARAKILPIGFSDPQLTPQSAIIRAEHIQEIRSGVH
jgi:hypothetical protein